MTVPPGDRNQWFVSLYEGANHSGFLFPGREVKGTRTHGSFVVTKNSSRGMPDSLIASPTAFSVPEMKGERGLVNEEAN